MAELTEELAAQFGEPKLFRPYRDVRFSADKTPIDAYRRGARRHRYVQLSAEGLAAGAGMWQLGSEQLARYRKAVASDRLGPELERIVAGIEKAGYRCTGTACSNPRPAATRSTSPHRTCSGTRGT